MQGVEFLLAVGVLLVEVVVRTWMGEVGMAVEGVEKHYVKAVGQEG